MSEGLEPEIAELLRACHRLLEHTRVDLTTVPDARAGDEVVVVGRQGNLEISPGEVAQRHGLSLHHVATTVGPRVARMYVSGGVTVKVVTPA